jgi:hypothetical protein
VTPEKKRWLAHEVHPIDLARIIGESIADLTYGDAMDIQHYLAETRDPQKMLLSVVLLTYANQLAERSGETIADRLGLNPATLEPRDLPDPFVTEKGRVVPPVKSRKAARAVTRTPKERRDWNTETWR